MHRLIQEVTPNFRLQMPSRPPTLSCWLVGWWGGDLSCFGGFWELFGGGVGGVGGGGSGGFAYVEWGVFVCFGLGGATMSGKSVVYWGGGGGA